MSEFLAEASVLIQPDTKLFRTELEAQLRAIKIAPIAVPITAVGAGLAGAAAATSSLVAAQKVAEKTALGLATEEQLLTTSFGKQAVILESLTSATLRQAGVQSVLDAANKKSTAGLLGAATASGKLDAGLLGLRTALGSTAVIGLGALALGAIVAGKAIRASITDFAAFQQELSTFRVVAGATADEMRSVSDEARKLGEDVRLPAVSSADAAVAMTELAKAGLSVEDAIAGARGVLELATAAQISNGEAALIAANALNSFGLAGDQASRVADDLANAANAAQGSISDFGQAFAQASAVARQVGLSLEDTTALLSLFAKNGLQGSDAGTSLRVALIRLINPTAKAAAEIKKLGLDIRDAQENVRPDIFAQFGEATRDLTPTARDAAAAIIFGQDSIRALGIGAREGVHGLRLMQFQIDQTGTASEVAAARTEGLAGAFGALQSSSQTLGVDFGRIVSVGLTPFIKAAADAALVTDKLIVKLSDLASGAGRVLGPLGKVADSFNRLVSSGPDKIPAVDELERLGFISIDENTKRISNLRDELIGLQKARVAGQDLVPGLSDKLTARIERLKDQIKSLKDEGAGITPSLTKPLQDAIAELEKIRDRKITIGADTTGIDRLIAKFKEQIPVAQETAREDARLTRGIDDLSTAGRNAAGGVDFLTTALKNLGRQSAQAQAALLKLQTEGGTPGQQIGVLQSDIDTQRKIIEDAKKRGGSGTASAIKKAREQILQDQNEIDSLQAGIVSDAKDAAAKAKTAAKEAQDARDDQFKALADMFGSRQQSIEDAISRAGIAGNLSKEIKLNDALQKALKKERQTLLARLKTLKVSAEERKQILNAISRAIENAQQDALRFAQEQKKNIQDALNTRLDLRIQLAEAKDNIKGQISAHKAKLGELRKELKALQKVHKGNTIAALQLKVDIAEEEKALKELGAQTKKSTLAAREFEFLQTQTGFVSNLLGNLIPGGATGGLVGGSPGPTTTLAGAPFKQSIEQGQTTAQATRERGVTAGQGSTQIDWLRKIYSAIQALNQNGQHPEAKHQRKVGSAIMDNVGGV